MKKIIFLGTLLLGVMTGCGDDFVDIENQNGISETSFLTTENQANQASVALYHPLTNHGMYRMGFLLFGDLVTDNIDNAGYGTGILGNAINALSDYRWEGTNKFIVNRWNACYQGIGRANYLIANIDKVENISQELYDQYLGEAYFMRGFYYYHLVIGFDDIPLITEPLASAEEANTVVKSSKEEIFTQIVTDLNQASNLLPISPANVAEVGRATKGAAFGLLSRVQLWTGDYQSAVDAADAVENLNKYTLVSSNDYIKMFDGQMENSQESIMEVQYVSGFGNYFSEDQSELSQMQNMLPRVPWAQYWGGRKNNLVESFEANDIRRIASVLIAFEDTIEYPSLSVSDVFPSSLLGEWNPRYQDPVEDKGNLQIRKYLPYEPINWGPAGASTWEKATNINIPLIRFSEVLLNKAEAYVQMGKVDEARTALEPVRTRAGLTMSNVPTDQAGLFAQIKNDRRNELVFEGHRWFDLKRWGDLESVLTAAGTDYNGTTKWPIPTIETDINPLLN